MSIRIGSPGSLLCAAPGPMKRTMFRRIFLVTLLAFAATAVVQADAPTVPAVLSTSETDVDRPVQLQIKVTDDNEATPPSEITVEGLDIRFSGQSQLIEGRNFHMSYSFIYSYTIMPLQAGTFTIPPQTVLTKNGNLRTPALTLNVAPHDCTVPPPGPHAGRANPH